MRVREQASKQLISHYKGEAERLLTMSQKSKAVAKSNRAEMMEREVNQPHRYYPWHCEGGCWLMAAWLWVVRTRR